MRLELVVALCALTSMAHADPTEDADTEASRRHYKTGTDAYARSDYAAALREFETAYSLKPVPELDFNIGRCHERLEHWAEAAAALQRYLDARPDQAEAPSLRQRIATLRARAPSAPQRPQLDLAPLPPAPALTAHRPSALAPALTGGLTLALAAAGTGGYLSAWSDYQAQSAACQGFCSPSSVSSLRTSVVTAEVAGGVLWGLAAVAAVVDVVLWVRWGRAPRPRATAWLVRF